MPESIEERLARAEVERDAALARAETAERAAAEAWSDFDEAVERIRRSEAERLAASRASATGMAAFLARAAETLEGMRGRLQGADAGGDELRGAREKLAEGLADRDAAKAEAAEGRHAMALLLLRLANLQERVLAAELEVRSLRAALRAAEQGAGLRVTAGGAAVAAFALAAAAGIVWTLYSPSPGLPLVAEREGPERLCREFVPGTPTAGLTDRAHQLRIARLGLFAPDGRAILDRPLAELSALDRGRFQDLLDRTRGRAVFGTRPSVALNRWCTIEFAEGKVTSSTARRHAP